LGGDAYTRGESEDDPLGTKKTCRAQPRPKKGPRQRRRRALDGITKDGSQHKKKKRQNERKHQNLPACGGPSPGTVDRPVKDWVRRQQENHDRSRQKFAPRTGNRGSGRFNISVVWDGTRQNVYTRNEGVTAHTPEGLFLTGKKNKARPWQRKSEG